MSKNEVCLKLALSVIEKGNYYLDSKTNEGLGKTVAEIFNSVYENVTCDAEPDGTATFG